MKSTDTIHVKIRGRTFRISQNEAVRLLEKTGPANLVPKRGKAPSYFVVVGGRKLPIKKAFKTIMDKKDLGLTLLDVTTRDAVSLFRRLDLPILVERGQRGSKSAILKHAGILAFEGSAVDDKRRLYDYP